MSHFYGRLQGARGLATRCGTKDSGMRAEATGWSIGGIVTAFVDVNGDDVINIAITRGTNNRTVARALSFKMGNNGDLIQVYP